MLLLVEISNDFPPSVDSRSYRLTNEDTQASYGTHIVAELSVSGPCLIYQSVQEESA